MGKTDTCEIPLKNREGISVIIDCHVRDAILADAYLQSIRFIDNLQMHSSGHAIFQRSINRGSGTKYETIYLHRWIADRFMQIPADAGGKRMFVHFKDGNVLNATIANLEYLSMTVLRRIKSEVKSIQRLPRCHQGPRTLQSGNLSGQQSISVSSPRPKRLLWPTTQKQFSFSGRKCS